jgi:DNA-binding SARP family transcriptional activator/tetratricopeptide (TPR) repeat protein
MDSRLRSVPSWHFGLLGDLTVSGPGGPRDVRGRRQRELLALLLLNANRIVPSEVLIDEIWSPGRGDSLLASLKMAVSRLRRSFGDGDASPAPDDVAPIATERIVTRGPGYQLIVHEGELDVLEFRRELQAGTAAVRDGDYLRARSLLADALSRWRGEALAEFRDSPWANLERLQLERMRIDALEGRISADLSLGEHRAVVGELEGLVFEHPEREQLQEYLMLALYRSGRQVDALSAFGRAREHLIAEFGIEPSEHLRAVHQAILVQDPALGPASPPAPTATRTSSPGLEPGLHRTLSSRLRVQSQWTFVGRARERAQLDAAINQSADGRHAVFVAGEPGIGKTRLVSEYAIRAHDNGVVVVAGRCDSDLGLPYQPFAELLDELLPMLADDVVDRHIDVHGTVLGRIAPALRVRAPSRAPDTRDDIEGAHHRLFVAAGDLLIEQARRAPLVLVLEDLHWGDEATVVLLKYLLTMPGADSLGVVGTYRSTELQGRPLSRLLPELHREQGIARIELCGLTDDDVVQLLRSNDDAILDEEIHLTARRLRHASAGNPFFLLQLLQSPAGSASDDGGRPEGAWAGESPLPTGLRETIIERVGRLGGRAPDLLTAAAVAGDEFELELLRGLAGVDDAELIMIIEAAIGAQLLVDASDPRSPMSFVHALVPEVLRAELSVTRRQALHRAVAISLERLYGVDGGDHIAALAHHWQQGWERGDLDRALHCTRLAAERASERLAPAEAAHAYRHALDLLDCRAVPEPSDRCEVLIRLGEAERQAGDPGFRETLLTGARLALDLGDRGRLVRAALANTRGFTSATGEIDMGRVEMLNAALDLTDPGDSPQRARLLAGKAVELAFCGQRSRPIELSASALAMARRCQDDTTLARVLSNRFFAIWAPDTLETRLAESAENVELCERLGDPVLQAQALHWRANACLEVGDLPGARRCVERTLEISDRTREPTIMWQSTYNRANLALALGDLEQAEPLAMEALELGQRSGQPDALAVFGAQLAYLRFVQGRLEELAPLLEQILVEHPGITGFRAVVALAYCEQHDHGQARAAMQYDASRDFATLADDVTWLSVTCIYAHVCARLDDRRSAAILYRMLKPWRDQVAVSVVAWGCVSHYLGMLAATLGEPDRAMAHMAAAAAAHDRMGTAIWRAQTQSEIARLVARPGPAAMSDPRLSGPSAN